jgi:hypothetical protein
MAQSRATSHSEEEITRISDANSEQTIRKNISASPDMVAETTVTSTSSPTSRSVKTQQSSGASPSAAREYGQTKTLFHAYQIIWYIFGFIEIVLAFRFILKLVGANPIAGFTKFVYGLSAPFVAPFLNMFRASSTRGAETTSYLEWSTIVAAIVYIVLTWALIKIFKLGKPTNQEEVEATVNQE